MTRTGITLGLVAVLGACSPAAWYVRLGPPPVRVEVVSSRPGAGFVWIAGFWHWDGLGYFWVPGRWVRPPRPRAVWIPGHWRETRRGWYWVPGHWRS